RRKSIELRAFGLQDFVGVNFQTHGTVREELHGFNLHQMGPRRFSFLVFSGLCCLIFVKHVPIQVQNLQWTETTSEVPGICASKGSNGNLRQVDLNEMPIMQKKGLLARMEALMKTVEMGRPYFPHCSEVLDKFMEDDLLHLFYLEKGSPTQRSRK
ncbi:NPR1/NIM1-like, partial [Theobroma cacao]